MQDSPEQIMIVTTKIRVQPDLKNAFVDWQAKLNGIIASFPGFVSWEILSPTDASECAWVMVERFAKPSTFANWRQSADRKLLMEELKKLLSNHTSNDIQESESSISQLSRGGVTEVFVTQVAPEKEKAYRDWIAKIHQVEAKFPGFRGTYVQSPCQGQGRNWITFLQFDTPENLDRWLSSPERQAVLEESLPLITSLESHRVISPYSGWFRSIAKEGEIPSVWKQTMIVLLVLFPIVMFELKFLSLWTSHLNSSLGTFIGNAISVILISWPMMPIAIWFLGWWLTPKRSKAVQATLWGTGLMILLYLLEIAIFWKFL